jgi:NAD(P)H-hydrate epimerase
MTLENRHHQIQRIIVTADQMRQIEARVFAAGMPVAALMEKVGGLVARRVEALYPKTTGNRIGVLVGPGHNGGDALVVARELHLRGYEVMVHCPFARLKDLTENHAHYCTSLGIAIADYIATLQDCDLLIDGLFGFGLEQPVDNEVAALINQINQLMRPVISIDLPSGLHTDTGEVLGTAIRATHTLCLGLWKLGLLQDHALDYVGEAELIDFDVPLADVQAVVGNFPSLQRITAKSAIAQLPLARPAATHKYEMGHLLLVCGSQRYAGGALLTGLGARASGVGMLSIAVPASLKPLLTAQLPEALILECPESASGAIAQLPDEVDLTAYDAIAAGPGLTLDAAMVMTQILASDHPLVLDADGLNLLTQQGTIDTLKARTRTTILTPHLGEFKRLFPDLADSLSCRVTAVRTAAQQTGAVVLLKGARVTIADGQGEARINPESTAALARGGSGDVLTGLIGGLLAQAIASGTEVSPVNMVQAAAWWHAQAGILAVQQRTVLGVDAFTLTQYLIPALHHWGIQDLKWVL